MSLFGRGIIDKLKSKVSHKLTLPCPPYGNPAYWENVYKTLGPQDAYEWGSLCVSDVLQYQYDTAKYADVLAKLGYHNQMKKNIPTDINTQIKTNLTTTTFAETIGIHPYDDISANSKILLVGCGNSRFGEDLIENGWCRRSLTHRLNNSESDDKSENESWKEQGKVIQVDVSQNALNSMSHRCKAFIDEGKMEFIHDDATIMSSLENNTMDTVIDKGLIDALYCSQSYDQIGDIMKSMYRILQPSKHFIVFSFSKPEYILQHMLQNNAKKQLWNSIQVRALDTILLYRFEKKKKHEKKLTRRQKRIRI